MKRLLYITLLVILVVNSNVEARDLKAYFSHSTFNTLNNGPYVETYLTVLGNSIVYKKNENGMFQGSINVSLIFKQEDKIVDFAKINLLSPETNDTTGVLDNFIDQQRFVLPSGNYMLEIAIVDNYSTNEPFNAFQQIEIDYNDQMSFSDLQLIEKFEPSAETTILTKSGFDLIPYVSNFYDEDEDRLKFYCELYHVNDSVAEGEKFLINYFIESYETHAIVNNYKRYLRQVSSPVCAVLGEFNIENLPTGNYYLTIEARSRYNTILTSKSLFFQRSNPSLVISEETLTNLDIESSFVKYINSKDTLLDYINCTFPIASTLEKRFIQASSDTSNIEMLQKFFLNFWQTRNRLMPEAEWGKYKEKVDYVNKEYSSVMRKGYETDRGRVYLQYGKPNTINKRYNEPSAYPYEVWQYYKTERRRNVRFIFYNEQQATNEFMLLHSTAYGEITDYKWQNRLLRRNNPSPGVDGDQPSQHWGNQIDDIFSMPR